MRAVISNYEIVTPRNLADALSALAAQRGAMRPLAGGTDLMVLLESGSLAPGTYLNIWGLGELRGIAPLDAGSLRVGALTTYAEVQRHAELAQIFPSLAAAARETGGIAIQNRGTLGGNVANASPAADSPPALLAYDASIELVGASGTRRVSYDTFHQGYKKTALSNGELIAAVILPRPAAGTRHYYRKVGTRKAQAISKVVMAGTARSQAGKLEHVRIAFGSVAPTVVRAKHVEALVVGHKVDESLIKAARVEVQKDIAPIDDIRSVAGFRRDVAANLVEEFLRSLV